MVPIVKTVPLTFLGRGAPAGCLVSLNHEAAAAVVGGFEVEELQQRQTCNREVARGDNLPQGGVVDKTPPCSCQYKIELKTRFVH